MVDTRPPNNRPLEGKERERMKTIVKEFNVYEYGELSEYAQERVRMFIGDLEKEQGLNVILSQDYEELLKDFGFVYPFVVRYSLGGCQGDGASFYLNYVLTTDIIDIINRVNLKDGYKYGGGFFQEYTGKEENRLSLTPRETEQLQELIENHEFEISIEDDKYCRYNHWNSVNRHYFVTSEGIENDGEWEKYLKVIQKVFKFIEELSIDLCHQMEKAGYEQIDSYYTNDYARGFCENNGCLFLADGTLFNE